MCFRVSVNDYPAPTWTVAWRLKQGTTYLYPGAVPSGTDHLVTLTAAQSATLAAGTVAWQLVATKGSEVRTVARGASTVHAPLAESGALDARSHAVRTLALIEAAIEGRIPAGMENYSVAGMSITKMRITELVTLRDKYREHVARERRAAALAAGTDQSGLMLTRFG